MHLYRVNMQESPIMQHSSNHHHKPLDIAKQDFQSAATPPSQLQQDSNSGNESTAQLAQQILGKCFPGFQLSVAQPFKFAVQSNSTLNTEEISMSVLKIVCTSTDHDTVSHTFLEVC